MQGMSYWVRNPTTGPLTRGASCDLTNAPADPAAAQQLSKTRPVVFLHGVGFGLVSHMMQTCCACTMVTMLGERCAQQPCFVSSHAQHAQPPSSNTAHEQGAGLACGCVHLYLKPAEHDVLSMSSI